MLLAHSSRGRRGPATPAAPAHQRRPGRPGRWGRLLLAGMTLVLVAALVPRTLADADGLPSDPFQVEAVQFEPSAELTLDQPPPVPSGDAGGEDQPSGGGVMVGAAPPQDQTGEDEDLEALGFGAGEEHPPPVDAPVVVAEAPPEGQQPRDGDQLITWGDQLPEAWDQATRVAQGQHLVVEGDQPREPVVGEEQGAVHEQVAADRPETAVAMLVTPGMSRLEGGSVGPDERSEDVPDPGMYQRLKDYVDNTLDPKTATSNEDYYSRLAKSTGVAAAVAGGGMLVGSAAGLAIAAAVGAPIIVPAALTVVGLSAGVGIGFGLATAIWLYATRRPPEGDFWQRPVLVRVPTAKGNS
jgi:hypothetical protein